MLNLVIYHCTRILGGWVRESVFSNSFHLGKISSASSWVSKLAALNSINVNYKVKTSFAPWQSWQIDMPLHLNVVNLRLQSREQNVSQRVGHFEAFREKLHLYSTGMCLKENDPTHFSSQRKLLADESTADFSTFAEEKYRLSLKKNLLTLTIKSKSWVVKKKIGNYNGDRAITSRAGIMWASVW